MNELIQLALDTFAFVLPLDGQFTFNQWALKIEEIYDNAQAWEVTEALRNTNGKITLRGGRVVGFDY